MLKKISIILVVGIFFIMGISSVYAYQALQGPTGVIQYDPSKAYYGYTLFGPPGELTYLIDMNGYVVNTWPRGGNPQLFENGNRKGGSFSRTRTGLTNYVVFLHRKGNHAGLHGGWFFVPDPLERLQRLF